MQLSEKKRLARGGGGVGSVALLAAAVRRECSKLSRDWEARGRCWERRSPKGTVRVRHGGHGGHGGHGVPIRPGLHYCLCILHLHTHAMAESTLTPQSDPCALRFEREY